MSPVIVRKMVLIAAGVLVLVQLLFYAAVRVGNIERSEQERNSLEQEVKELSVTQSELLQYHDQLQKEYNEMMTSMPKEFLEGYEDPDVLLAGFLDYLKASELDRVDASFTMIGGTKFVEKPVPYFEQDLNIAFSFIDLSEARDMINRILDQDSFPLAVRKFNLRKSGQKKISGDMQISLIIPARQKQPLSAAMQQEAR